MNDKASTTFFYYFNTYKNTEARDNINMSKIVDNLFVAGVDETYKNEELKASVTHFLNVASEVEIAERVDHGYHKVGINDDDDKCDIRTILPESIEWINKVVQEGGSVCVHCLEGKSRSVCVCIAYMCCCLGWNFDEALERVQIARPCLDIWPLYKEQLRMFVE